MASEQRGAGSGDKRTPLPCPGGIGNGFWKREQEVENTRYSENGGIYIAGRNIRNFLRLVPELGQHAAEIAEDVTGSRHESIQSIVGRGKYSYPETGNALHGNKHLAWTREGIVIGICKSRVWIWETCLVGRHFWSWTEGARLW